jgi:2-iminobutanoate/2-iminopropanoate deaminase
MYSIQAANAPKAVGPYSQAIVENGVVYCSGQIGIDPTSGQLVEGIEQQTQQVMQNLQAVLEASESDFGHVVKTTIYVQNMEDYAKVNEVYGTYFTEHKPARATVAVAKLPLDALVEIDAIAVVK